MLSVIDNIIDQSKLQNDSFNVNDFVKEAKILFKNYFDIKSKSKTRSFENNMWSYKDLISDQTFHFNFDNLTPLISFNKEINKDEFILMLKCWTIYNLNNMSPSFSFNQFSNLSSICYFTKGLKTNFSDLVQMIKNSQVYTKEHSNSTNYIVKNVSANTAKRYIDSLINFSNFYGNLPIDSSVFEELSLASDRLKINVSSRNLPHLTEFLNFKDCLEHYYSELIENEDMNKKELIKYYPIMIWWSLTTIIPMRPSEFCMIKRDCISGNKITFPRFKQRRNKVESRKNITYDTVPIPKTLIKKIEHYIELTDSYGQSNSLISFRAFVSLSIKNKKRNVDYETKYFSIKYLRFLLNKFYQEVIIEKYKLTVTQQLKPGDLRHISIISMMLQGYDRVEIQRLAGHFDINTQYSYVDHMHFWVDTEIQTLSDQFTLYNKDEYRSPHAIETFNTMFYKQIYSELSQTFTDNGESIKLEVGYCKDKTMPCPTFNWNYTGCYFCNNWGISMSELQDNKELIIKELSMIYNELHRKINYLGGLYNIHHLDKYGNINPEIKTELKLTTQEIEQDKLAVSKLSYMLGVESHE